MTALDPTEDPQGIAPALFQQGRTLAATVASDGSSTLQGPTEVVADRFFYLLALGALGVVYGDIGTSPLYAIKECVTASYGVSPTAANIFGVLSLAFWSLTFVVSIKYLAFVMRADTASWCWARWSCVSPAARPCTPTWATSGRAPSASRGRCACSRRC